RRGLSARGLKELPRFGRTACFLPGVVICYSRPRKFSRLRLKSQMNLSLYLNTQREKCMYMLAGFYVQPESIANVHACWRKVSWTLNRMSLMAGIRLAMTASANMTNALAK